MIDEARTAVLIRRPRVLMNALHELAEFHEMTPGNLESRTWRFATHTLPAIAHEAATTVGHEEFVDACTNCTLDDVEAARCEHEEAYGKVLPWDGTIIKMILANLPAIIEALKVLIALLAKKS